VFEMPFCFALREDGGPGPRSAGAECCGGRGTAAGVWQRNKPWGRCWSSLRAEPRSSFRKQEPICERPGDSWPWPGSSCWSWRQDKTSEEGQTLLDYSLVNSRAHPSNHIKSNHIVLEYLCFQRPRRHSYLQRVHTDCLPGVLSCRLCPSP